MPKKKKPRIAKSPSGASYYVDNPNSCPDSSILAWGMHLLRQQKKRKRR